MAIVDLYFSLFLNWCKSLKNKHTCMGMGVGAMTEGFQFSKTFEKYRSIRRDPRKARSYLEWMSKFWLDIRRYGDFIFVFV